MKLTNEQLEALKAVAERATPGNRSPVLLAIKDGGRPANKREQIQFAIRCIESGGDEFFIVNVDRPDGTRRILCFTANGKTSKANAQQIAAFDRETCIALVEELQAARKIVDNPPCSHGDCRERYGDSSAWCCKCSGDLSRYREEVK